MKRQAETPAPHLTHLWLALSWVLPYAVFLSVWLPRNGFYKLFIWPPIVLLLGRYLSLRPWAISGASALLAAMIGWNFAAYVYPRSHDSAAPVVEFAKKLNGQLPHSAVIYYRSFVPDDWYLRYFTPDTEWKPFNGPYPALLPTNSRACFETTALALPVTQLPRLSSKYEWDLVSAKYNIRVQCTD
jgi:hypothetical protein